MQARAEGAPSSSYTATPIASDTLRLFVQLVCMDGWSLCVCVTMDARWAASFGGRQEGKQELQGLIDRRRRVQRV